MAPKRSTKDKFIGSSKITGLLSSNFREFLSEKNIALVMFYDPNCPMCQQMKPHFLKTTYVTNREGQSFAAVDCTAEPELCREEMINRLPSFKLYSKGRPVNVFGGRIDYRTLKKYVENAPNASRIPVRGELFE
ncbi:Protein disulfide-isomerase A5 [Biomphalaria glabrata]|nr:protein disulfide-isomerase A5-like isoform X1 [Biomphalaria glabrata]KAI8787733.1 protein disulfide-isomerase A5 isoform X1 [Biomphalaria glabrata]